MQLTGSFALSFIRFMVDPEKGGRSLKRWTEFYQSLVFPEEYTGRIHFL
jgi:hypothetical protein